MQNTVTLETFKGTIVGTDEQHEWDFDDVKINGTRVAFVSHVENATVRMLRIMTPSTMDHLLSEIKRLRAEQGKPSIAERVAKLPDPAELKAAHRLYKKGAA